VVFYLINLYLYLYKMDIIFQNDYIIMMRVVKRNWHHNIIYETGFVSFQQYTLGVQIFALIFSSTDH